MSKVIWYNPPYSANIKTNYLHIPQLDKKAPL